jgi:hypothetical protein
MIRTGDRKMKGINIQIDGIARNSVEKNINVIRMLIIIPTAYCWRRNFVSFVSASSTGDERGITIEYPVAMQIRQPNRKEVIWGGTVDGFCRFNIMHTNKNAPIRLENIFQNSVSLRILRLCFIAFKF